MLSVILPSEGYYCVAIAAGKGFIHKFFSSTDQANLYALQQDGRNKTVYIAQATYSKTAVDANASNRKNKLKRTDKEWQKVRAKENALFLRSFFVDIDCGKNKPYPTQREGLTALLNMVSGANLPVPAVVSSGGGLYAYWPMSQDVPVRQWEKVAQLLKQVMPAYGLNADPAPTANAATVLRPVGTTNRKPGRAEREVTLLAKGRLPVYDFVMFATAVATAGKVKKIKSTIASAPKKSTLLDDMQVYQDVPSYAKDIADKCAQVGNLRKQSGNVPEPEWYATIGLLRHTEDGEALIHKWSSGYAGYSEQLTNDKIEQHKSSGIGPTTCAFFGSINPSLCVGCPHKDKIVSPIVLGRPAPVAVAMPSAELMTPPAPFTITETGLYYQDGDVAVKFYDHKLYPIRLAHDTGLGYEVITLRHHTAHDGENDVTIRTSLVNDHKALMTAFWDNHIHVVGAKEKKIMCAYIEGYAKHLQSQRALSRLMSQMGWTTLKGMDAFVLGTKIYYADGTIEDSALAGNVPEAAAAFHSHGSLEEWTKLSIPLQSIGTEAFAFALLAGGFGAPLMRFTGYEGAIVSLEGKSGIGKTLVSRWVQSVYGEQSKLMMLRDDTRNSLVARLGTYGSLPMTIDEVTNIDPAELSDLVYRITQGRDKARLTKNAVERPGTNHWNTLAVVSSNSSLIEKLSGLKADASAEMNRVFEYAVASHPALDRAKCTEIFRGINDNYGTAGEVYIHHIVQSSEKHRDKIDALTAYIENEAGVTSEDRFWCAIIAVAIYGGSIAQKLNLVQFNVKRVLTWAISQLRMMKAARSDNVQDSISLLGEFLTDNVSRSLVVTVHNPRDVQVHRAPMGGLVYRTETLANDKTRVIISRQAIKEFLKRRYASYKTLVADLQTRGPLLEPNRRRVLGAGTHFGGGGQQECWIVDPQHPAMKYVGANILEQIELDKQLMEQKKQYDKEKEERKRKSVRKITGEVA